MSLRDRIKQKSSEQPALVQIFVEDWGETVYIRGMDAAERGMLLEMQSKARPEDLKLLESKICELAVCDESGASLYRASEWQTLRPGRVVGFLANSVLEQAGLTKDAMEAAKKNSRTTPSSDSSTVSVANSEFQSSNCST